jgi:hypothetical protein
MSKNDDHQGLFDFDVGGDVCRNKHGGNPESEAAYERRRHIEREQLRAVYEDVRDQGDHGATTHEVAARQGRLVNAVSPDMTKLKKWGYIVRLVRDCKKISRPTETGALAGVFVAVLNPVPVNPDRWRRPNKPLQAFQT